MMIQRKKTIDVLKGCLIILVILGHVLLGGLDENPLRFLIYSFHMPMFLFISGYLLNLNKLFSQSLKTIILHYAKRMLGCWFLAWCFFTVLLLNDDITLKSIAHNALYPYYHLWYVPSLFAMICVVRCLHYLIEQNKWYYFVLFILSLCFLLVGRIVNFPKIADFSYFVYFVLGLFCKNRSVKAVYIPMTQVFYTVLILILWISISDLSWFNYFPILICPIVITLILKFLYPLIERDIPQHYEILTICGKGSLHIYLWHMVPIFLLKHFFSENMVLYYLLSFLLLISGYIAIRTYLCYKTKI